VTDDLLMKQKALLRILRWVFGVAEAICRGPMRRCPFPLRHCTVQSNHICWLVPGIVPLPGLECEPSVPPYRHTDTLDSTTS
jgi:hypothetical protein